ncbi:MAG: DNA alkylation repair protein [Micromonosporaceae bacterium]
MTRAASPSLPTVILDRLQDVYRAAADADRAPAMQAYMRNQFPFLGIPSPTQRTLARQVVEGLPAPSEAALKGVAYGCWELPEREYQYFASHYLRRHSRRCGKDFIAVAAHLITKKSWWDTVDALAAHLVGPLVQRYLALKPEMDRWAHSDNIWLIRSALLHQLRAQELTDSDRLFEYCRLQAGNRDFFVRNAIGWALRDYARTDPTSVRRFVAANRTRLSPLSAREALRNINA